MPFCVQCGAKLDEGAKFCGECGARQPDPAVPSYTRPTDEPVSPVQSVPSYDPTIYAGESKPAKKKNGALVFVILAALIVVGALAYVIISMTGAKTPSADEAVLGLYTAQKAETSGLSISIKTMWKNGFTIELQNGGKAAINVDGEKGSAKWTLDGESFTIKGSGVDCSGTLSNGVLTLEDVMDTGVTLYFTKEGASLSPDVTDAPAAGTGVVPAPENEPAPAAQNGEITGLYLASKAEAYGVEVEISSMWEKGFSIELQDGGKCRLSVNGTEGSGTWSGSGDTVTVDVPGFNMDGRIENGVLVFEDLYGMGVTLYFTRDGAAVPSVGSAPALQPDSWWSGDWYGWWSSVDAGGTYLDKGYAGLAWDVCATIEINSDGSGRIEIWDEDGDDVAEARVGFEEGAGEKGCMVNRSGIFYNQELEAGEWRIDPTDAECGGFDDLICIYGHYEQPSNEENWIDYYIYLRPWGTRWEDIENGDSSGMVYPGDMMPINYESWYLPLIEANEKMPEDFEGLD